MTNFWTINTLKMTHLFSIYSLFTHNTFGFAILIFLRNINWSINMLRKTLTVKIIAEK